MAYTESLINIDSCRISISGFAAYWLGYDLGLDTDPSSVSFCVNWG